MPGSYSLTHSPMFSLLLNNILSFSHSETVPTPLQDEERWLWAPPDRPLSRQTSSIQSGRKRKLCPSLRGENIRIGRYCLPPPPPPTSVCPVEMVVDPVHCQPVSRHHASFCYHGQVRVTGVNRGSATTQSTSTFNNTININNKLEAPVQLHKYIKLTKDKS